MTTNRITLLGYVFKRLDIRVPETFSERIYFQKIIYLLQSFGLETHYTFRWDEFGPYCRELSQDRQPIFEIFATRELGSADLDIPEDTDQKLKNFCGLLGNHLRDDKFIEILASLHYIIQQNLGIESKDAVAWLIYLKPRLKDRIEEDSQLILDLCDKIGSRVSRSVDGQDLPTQ